MELKLVELKTAQLAKSIGFDWPVADYYTPWKGRGGHEPYTTTSCGYQTDMIEVTNWNTGQGSYPTKPEDVLCSAPTQSLLQKWLRDVKFIHISITTVSQHSWQCYITEPGEYMEESNMYDSFMSYEDALEGGLLRALLHIKESIS